MQIPDSNRKRKITDHSPIFQRDFIVANDVTVEEAGFAAVPTGYNLYIVRGEVTFLFPNEEGISCRCHHRIIDRVVELMNHKMLTRKRG